MDKKDEAPKLFSLPKKNVYRVPQGFFAEMESGIREQYITGKKSKLKRIRKWTELSVAAAIVAMVIFSGIKSLLGKQYFPVETIRTIYTIQDGDLDGE